jgi:Tfp pilus assembly major pilin PilA
MQLQHRQRGLGLWGWIFVLGVIGFVSMVTLKLVPIYLAEMAIARVVKSTAQDPGNSNAPIQALRNNMKTRWDVEGITTLDVKDVTLEKYGAGRALAYDYEARTELFYNISLVVHFENKFPMPGGGGIE